MTSLMLLSQSSTVRTDTCYGRTVVRKLLIRAQQADILEDDVKTLEAKIKDKERELRVTTVTDSLLIASLGREIMTLNDQKKIAVSSIQSLEKQLKKQKRTTRLVGIAGIICTAGALFLIK